MIKKTFLEGNSTEINKGDKIRVIKGDLNGLSGSVVTIENNNVHFKPNIENYDQTLMIDSTYVVKIFEAGD